MRLAILLALVSFSTLSFAQGKFFTRDGHVKFFSATPIENIEADNHKLTCVLDAATGKFEFAALMKSFEFEKPLMEEHFNENYVESNKFPKSTFKGSIDISSLDMSNIAAGTKVIAKGVMEIHGVSKEVEIPATIESKDGGYHIGAKFMVTPEEYDIAIPNTVRDNIAKEIEVTVDAQLKALNR